MRKEGLKHKTMSGEKQSERREGHDFEIKRNKEREMFIEEEGGRLVASKG